MDFLFSFIDNYSIIIIIGLLTFDLIMVFLFIISNARISKLSKKYRKFMRGSKDKNIEELLLDIVGRVDRASENTDKVKALYEDVDKRVGKCVQKVSMTRYKAFDDIGSAALSFSIAFLDAYDSGVILTGIYGRDESTTYAKPIEKGVPKFELSDEEKKVLEEAMRKKANTK